LGFLAPPPKHYYYFRYYQYCTFHKQNISVDILKSEMFVAKNCLVKIKENFDIDNIKTVVTEDIPTQIYINCYRLLLQFYSFHEPDLHIQGCQVPVKRSIRYLGVRLDTRLSFVEHIGTVATGARKAATALSRLMPNVGGPSQSKRSLLMSVIHSRLLYGAVIWSERVSKTQKSKNLLLQAQSV
jgi:hypothetical protein